jgi:uncharacterized protein (DUF849 family)
MLHARPRGGDAESAAGVERHTLQAVREQPCDLTVIDGVTYALVTD